jgi:hypothetical protein
MCFRQACAGGVCPHAGITAAFLFHPNVKTYVASNPWTLWTPLIASFALVITLSCSQAARRSHPLNLIMVGMVGSVDTQQRTQDLLEMVSCTCTCRVRECTVRNQVFVVFNSG